MSLSFEERERERTREQKCQQRLGKSDRRNRIATRRKSKTKKTTKNDDELIIIKTLALTWRTPAPDDLQKRLLVILGQVRFRALQPHSQRGQFRLEDAENVLHVRLGEIVRVDRDVFAAVADWDLDQSNCTNITLSLLLRHDRKFPFKALNRSLESVLCATTKAETKRRKCSQE